MSYDYKLTQLEANVRILAYYIDGWNGNLGILGSQQKPANLEQIILLVF